MLTRLHSIRTCSDRRDISTNMSSHHVFDHDHLAEPTPSGSPRQIRPYLLDLSPHSHSSAVAIPILSPHSSPMGIESSLDHSQVSPPPLTATSVATVPSTLSTPLATPSSSRVLDVHSPGFEAGSGRNQVSTLRRTVKPLVGLMTAEDPGLSLSDSRDLITERLRPPTQPAASSSGSLPVASIGNRDNQAVVTASHQTIDLSTTHPTAMPFDQAAIDRTPEYEYLRSQQTRVISSSLVQSQPSSSGPYNRHGVNHLTVPRDVPGISAADAHRPPMGFTTVPVNMLINRDTEEQDLLDPSVMSTLSDAPFGPSARPQHRARPVHISDPLSLDRVSARDRTILRNINTTGEPSVPPPRRNLLGVLPPLDIMEEAHATFVPSRSRPTTIERPAVETLVHRAETGQPSELSTSRSDWRSVPLRERLARLDAHRVARSPVLRANAEDGLSARPMWERDLHLNRPERDFDTRTQGHFRNTARVHAPLEMDSADLDQPMPPVDRRNRPFHRRWLSQGEMEQEYSSSGYQEDLAISDWNRNVLEAIGRRVSNDAPRSPQFSRRDRATPCLILGSDLYLQHAAPNRAHRARYLPLTLNPVVAVIYGARYQSMTLAEPASIHHYQLRKTTG